MRHAAQQRLAWLAKGGYPADRRVPDRLRGEVLGADDGRCAECRAAPATKVDHVAAGSRAGQPAGLSAPCHRARSAAALVPAGAEAGAVQQAFVLLAHLPPARLAHDERRRNARRRELLRRTREWRVMARAYGAMRPAVTVWGDVDWGDDDGESF